MPAMEIGLVESRINRFENPNSLALLLHLTDLKTFWTWVALILAAIAAFSSLIRRTKLVILRCHKGRSVIPHPSFYSFSSSDDESCSSSDDDDDGEEEDEVSSSGDDYGNYEELHGQNTKMDNHFNWPELGRGESVVKAWDGPRLGFDQSNGSISLLDQSRNEILRSFFSKTGEIQAVHVAPPAMVLSAEEESDETVAVRFWDARAASEAPAADASATWKQGRRGRVAGIGGWEGKVYVGDDVGKVSVMDLRNARSMLGETWWWRDGAVTMGDGEGLVSWCRNAARCLTLLPEPL